MMSIRTGRGLRLIRPLNLIVVAVGTVAGFVLSAGDAPLLTISDELVLVALAAVLIAAGANAHNDARDVEIDRINRPQRPIPAGDVSQRAALWVWFVATVAGLFASLALSPKHFAIAATLAALLGLYNEGLKHVAIAGNAVVAASVAATLLFGAITNGITVPVVVGVSFAFLSTMAREIVKDLQDIDGDRIVDSASLPAVAGVRLSRGVASMIVVATTAAVPLPYIYWGFSGLYLLLAFPTALLLLSAASHLVDAGRSHGLSYMIVGYARASALLKVSMIFGLASLLVYGVAG